MTALSGEGVKNADFAGCVIFLEGCFGDLMADAFLIAGAKAVVGNAEATLGHRWLLGPAEIVGRAWLRGMREQLTVNEALRMARLEVKPPFDKAWFIKGEGNEVIQWT